VKKKIFLRVKQKGVMFQLGNQKFRSPVDVDITQYKIDPILAQMRIYGISEYEIYTEEPSKIINKDNIKVIIVNSKTDEVDRLNSKVEKLENLIYNLLEQNDEKDREQNNKSDVSLSETEDKIVEEKNIDTPLEPKSDPEIEVKKVKNKIKRRNIKKAKTVTIRKPNIKEPPKVEKVKIEKVESESYDELKNKKIIIEELENVEDVKLEGLGKDIEVFKPKTFNKKLIEKNPFEISSDVEMLKKYKKK